MHGIKHKVIKPFPCLTHPQSKLHLHAFAAKCSLSLLELLGDLGSDSVHVGGSLLGQRLALDFALSVLVLVGDLSDQTGLFELDEAVPDALSGGESVVLGAGSVPLLG